MLTLLVWSCLALAAADEAPKAPTQDQVDLLVRRLDAAQLGERDEAERKLGEFGAAVLPLLPAVDDQTPPEAAQRLARLRQQLLRAQAAAAAEPTLVTLKGELPLADVLKEITKQTGNTLIDHREAMGQQQSDIKIQADFDKTPFWKALDTVLDQGKLTLYSYVGQRGAYLVNRSGGETRAANAVYSGLFRLEPVRFEAMRDLRNAEASGMKFFMEISWEPRLQPFAIMQPLGDVRATAPGGEAIAVENADAEPEAQIREGMSSVELEVPLNLPARSVQKIELLKGKLLALVPGPVQDFRFSNIPIAARNAPGKRIEQRKAGATVAIDQLRKNNALWEVAVRVKFEAPATALESHRSWVLDNEAFFENAKGEKIEPGGIEQTLQSKDEVGISYLFQLEEGPQKLTFVYRTPITVLEVPIQYEFRDLRLP